MADVDEIVNLGPPTDFRHLQGAAVDGGVSADLHIVFNEEHSLLRKLDVGSGGGIADVAKSVGAENRAGVDDNAVTHHGSGIQDHVGINVAVLTDMRSAAHDHAGINAASDTDVCTFLDHGAGANRNV